MLNEAVEQQIEFERLFYIAVNANALSEDILRSNTQADYVRSAAVVQQKAAQRYVRAYLDKKVDNETVKALKEGCHLLNGCLNLQLMLARGENLGMVGIQQTGTRGR